MQDKFNEYVKNRTLQNWKFWIVSFRESMPTFLILKEYCVFTHVEIVPILFYEQRRRQKDLCQRVQAESSPLLRFITNGKTGACRYIRLFQ